MTSPVSNCQPHPVHASIKSAIAAKGECRPGVNILDRLLPIEDEAEKGAKKTLDLR